MKIKLVSLQVITRRTVEAVEFSSTATFIYGPIGKGKSTVARLIDYCFGGTLERTPAIQSEFVSAELTLEIGAFLCVLERAATDTQHVRVNWNDKLGNKGSVSAPLSAGATPLIEADVYNLSDLIFHLSGIAPIKVRQNRHDPDAPLIRLSFRDLLFYCYLDQDHLDSSFFRLEDAFRSIKSRNAMRFFTGLHSDRLNQLEIELSMAVDEQRSKREAVKQIRAFMEQFKLTSSLDIQGQIQTIRSAIEAAAARRAELEVSRRAETHFAEPLRDRLRRVTQELTDTEQAIIDLGILLREQEALRAELITAKVKAVRAEQAKALLDGAEFQQCPRCGVDLPADGRPPGRCCLCGSQSSFSQPSSLDLEVLRRDLNERIDEISDSLKRRVAEGEKLSRKLGQIRREKDSLDQQLVEQLRNYDSSFLSNVRALDREIATLEERSLALVRLQELPEAINRLEEETGLVQGRINKLRNALKEERARLKHADKHIRNIEQKFLGLMTAIKFPGVYQSDHVRLDPRNWNPVVVHGSQEWGFFDAGSGGKKTLFNVCYALAIHAVALSDGLPVPSFLIIDSPTKNISEDENPELVKALYHEIYGLVGAQHEQQLQVLLIDSDLTHPADENFVEFRARRMAGVSEAPSLISYYEGP